MRQVAIIGAGELGGAVAHALARRDAARSILLIDEAGRVAEGKALDIAQSAPIEPFAAQVAGSTDFAAAAGADVIVFADRVSGGEWRGDDGLLLVRRLAASAPTAALLCAGAAQYDLIDRGVRDVRIPRTRLFGSAPEALAGAARALVALAVDGSPADVALSVLGIPPSHTVVPWEDATIGGFALARRVDEPTRRALVARIGVLWPPGPHALAAAAAAAIEAMAGIRRRLVSCFVGPETSGGTRTRTAAMPVALGADGIVEVVLPPLSVVEQVALENAMQL